jgi:predicted NUDIX family NTP pyrophosphohydrolase
MEASMAKKSAGLLMFRRGAKGLEVLLVHPGGPFWAKKDLGVWTVPKGEVKEGEGELEAARREFAEETGLAASEPLIPLGSVKHKSGKVVTAWAFCGDCDAGAIKSNTFTMEWPPKSGRQQEFPEIDRAAFFGLEEARRKIITAEAPLLEALAGAAGRA